ncbi:MAG: two-component system sensor histidine kinase NtrB [Acidobacteriota bacterium]
MFAAAAALLVAVNALVWSLYRSEIRAVEGGLDDRLVALGTTAAKWLSSGGGGDAALAALVTENKLEDAYVIDAGLHVTAGVRTRAGTPLNLMRVDPDRLAAAQAGHASSGPGYSIEQAAVETAYFPLSRDGQPYVLALEAGAEYRAPAARLRATYLVAVGLTVLVAVVFAAALFLALRALERARVAYGRAERLAAVGQMAAMVAHEVRNPLGILRGQVELARERLGPSANERERERFAEMLAEIDRLNRLTEEFLGLARDLPVELVPLDLAGLARQIADEARLAAVAKEATIEVAAPEALEVHGDAHRLRQAILNLVLNAVQIGGPGVTVRLEVARAGDRARVTIADDGPGVPADLAEKLFEPFVTARPGGSGLGLAVARRIAERHHGSLILESRPGERGARFSIYIPLP